mmetsp:Transcript_116582/g.329719  ORF Transcript_116582/g.329719 Transcript_116582/m.329719 type:complete len:213 (-) Transcript_116582:356-994(-)
MRSLPCDVHTDSLLQDVLNLLTVLDGGRLVARHTKQQNVVGARLVAHRQETAIAARHDVVSRQVLLTAARYATILFVRSVVPLAPTELHDLIVGKLSSARRFRGLSNSLLGVSGDPKSPARLEAQLDDPVVHSVGQVPLEVPCQFLVVHRAKGLAIGGQDRAIVVHRTLRSDAMHKAKKACALPQGFIEHAPSLGRRQRGQHGLKVLGRAKG